MITILGSGWKLTAGLGLLAGAIALNLPAERPPAALTSVGVAQRVPAQSTGQRAAQTIEPDAAPKEAYAAIAERPLFHPSRRPIPPTLPQAAPAPVVAVVAAAPPPPSPGPLQAYTLVGVAMSGEARIALLKSPSQSGNISLMEGGSLHGWTASKISESRVLFHSGTQEFALELPKPIPGAALRTLPAQPAAKNGCEPDGRTCPSM